jgi:thioredoxin-dependent peroxiredoxin
MRASARAVVATALLLSACGHRDPSTSKPDGDALSASSDLLPVGAPAPDFSIVAHDGQPVQLSALKGRNVVLYFYPKDDTPGCTKEACEFRDAWGDLQKAGVAVFGVSTQSTASHQAFADKYNLPFPLLPDRDSAIAAKYHVRVFLGLARRVTYLIGPDGRIAHVWPSVKPIGHAADILSVVRHG